MTFATFLCRMSLSRGGECETVRRFEGGKLYLQCVHCGSKTCGVELSVNVADVPGTAPYYAEILGDMLDVELKLHGGG